MHPTHWLISTQVPTQHDGVVARRSLGDYVLYCGELPGAHLAREARHAGPVARRRHQVHGHDANNATRRLVA